MGGSVSRYTDGQLAIPAFDNGGDQVSSDAMQFSKYSILIVFLSLGTSHDTINNKIVMPSGFISFYSLSCISICVA